MSLKSIKLMMKKVILLNGRPHTPFFGVSLKDRIPAGNKKVGKMVRP